MTVVDKVGHPAPGEEPSLQPGVIRREVADSLRRLGTDRIDVLILHRDDPRQPVEAVLDGLRGLCRAGQVRRFGASNWTLERLAAFVASAGRTGERPPVSYQFSLAVPARPLWPGARHASTGILDLVKAERLQLHAWSAQARGWFALPAGPPVSAPDGPAAFDTAANREARVRCRALAADHGVAPATVALAWTLAQDDLNVHPIIGPECHAELAESLAAEHLKLTAREVAWLSATRDLQDTPGSAAGTSS
jgi:aryl-alcohol dehydrogenase-like predicted oxidoreductase